MVPCATWAIAPLHTTPPNVPHIEAPLRINQSQPTSKAEIDRRVFAAKLWNPPPPTPAPAEAAVKPTPEARPLNMQLIGIIEENGARRAAVYDADVDCLIILANGDHIHEQTVTNISFRGIELSDGHVQRKLVLREKPS